MSFWFPFPNIYRPFPHLNPPPLFNIYPFMYLPISCSVYAGEGARISDSRFAWLYKDAETGMQMMREKLIFAAYKIIKIRTPIGHLVQTFPQEPFIKTFTLFKIPTFSPYFHTSGLESRLFSSDGIAFLDV